MLWLLRLRRWATHPPSRKMRWLIAGVVLASLALYFFEQVVGWPEWLTVNKTTRW